MKDKVIILNLTVEETNLVLQALGELPAKFSVNALIKIQQQAQGQMQDVVKNDGTKESE